MSSQPNESFNVNLLQNPGAESPGEPAAGTDGASFAAQLAGGGAGAEFVLPAPKKSLSKGTIIFVVVAALAAGGLWWMKQRTGGPAPAEAADAGVDAARASIQQFLAGGSGSVSEMKTLLADSENITDKFASFNENRQVPLEELKTNPFYHEIPLDDSATLEAPRLDLSRQQQEARRIEMERLSNAAAQLQVQTIFFGRNPTAMIGGKICQVGQQIGEFKVTAIRADAVELGAGAHRFELKLKR